MQINLTFQELNVLRMSLKVTIRETECHAKSVRSRLGPSAAVIAERDASQAKELLKQLEQQMTDQLSA